MTDFEDLTNSIEDELVRDNSQSWQLMEIGDELAPVTLTNMNWTIAQMNSNHMILERPINYRLAENVEDLTHSVWQDGKYTKRVSYPEIVEYYRPCLLGEAVSWDDYSAVKHNQSPLRPDATITEVVEMLELIDARLIDVERVFEEQRSVERWETEYADTAFSNFFDDIMNEEPAFHEVVGEHPVDLFVGRTIWRNTDQKYFRIESISINTYGDSNFVIKGVTFPETMVSLPFAELILNFNMLDGHESNE